MINQRLRKLDAVQARWQRAKQQARVRLARAQQAVNLADNQLAQYQQIQEDYRARREPVAAPSAQDLANLLHLEQQLRQVVLRTRSQKQQASELLDQCRAGLLGWESKLLGLKRLQQNLRQEMVRDAAQRDRRRQNQAPWRSRPAIAGDNQQT